MLVNEWAWLRSTSLLIKSESALGFSFGVRAQTEMKIWCIKGTRILKKSQVKKKTLGVNGVLINLINSGVAKVSWQ